MLTDSEREWAIKKSKWIKRDICYLPDYPTKDELLDALEFSERVSAMLAIGCESQTPCNGCWRANWKFCNLRRGYWDCADCFLKAARLIVEEKMDGQESRN